MTNRHPAEVYGTEEHEAWLLAKEIEDEQWAGFPETPVLEPDWRGCACVSSRIYGGDCQHTISDDDLDSLDESSVSHTYANGVSCYDPNPIVWVSSEDCLHEEQKEV